MIKGTTDAGLIELYHMEKDVIFRTSPDEFSRCRTLTFRDESLRASNPAQWEIQSGIWARAHQRCGIPAPS
jgi:hypothetical protein